MSTRKKNPRQPRTARVAERRHLLVLAEHVMYLHNQVAGLQAGPLIEVEFEVGPDETEDVPGHA